VTRHETFADAGNLLAAAMALEARSPPLQKEFPLLEHADEREIASAYLAGVRYALRSIELAEGFGQADPVLLKGLLELEVEVGSLVRTALENVGIFFWDGPKRHIPAKLKLLHGVGSPSLSVRLQKGAEYLAAGGPVSPPASDPALVVPFPPEYLAGFDSASRVWPLVRCTSESCPDAKAAVEFGATTVLLDDFASEHAVAFAALSASSATFAARARPSETAEAWRSRVSLLPRNPDVVMLTVLDAPVGKQCTRAKTFGQRFAFYGLPTVSLAKGIAAKCKPEFWVIPTGSRRALSASAHKDLHKAGVLVVAFSGEPEADHRVAAVGLNLPARVVAPLVHLTLGMHVAVLSTDVSVLQDSTGVLPLDPLWMAQILGARVAAVPLDVTNGVRDVHGVTREVARPVSPQFWGYQSTPSINPAHMVDVENMAEQFYDNFNIIYVEDFFDADTFMRIDAEVNRLWKSADDVDGNCNLDGRHRLGGYVLDWQSRSSSLYELIYGNEPFRQYISAVTREDMFPSDFPIEIREYGPQSSGMNCHADLQLYSNNTLDLEMVFTVDNDSDCVTSFTDRNGTEHKQLTKANSLIMVRPNSAVHCVSPTRGGHRTILKFIYVGDFRKHDEFLIYTDNSCPESQENRKRLQLRREERSSTQYRTEM